MGERFTDKKAVRLALFIAIDTETQTIEAYRYDRTEDAVQNAERNIAAFRRVLARYYGETEHPMDKRIQGEKVDARSIGALLKGHNRRFTPPKKKPHETE